jgi:hypothetical protein
MEFVWFVFMNMPNLNAKQKLKENVCKDWQVILCWILAWVGGERQILSLFFP